MSRPGGTAPQKLCSVSVTSTPLRGCLFAAQPQIARAWDTLTPSLAFQEYDKAIDIWSVGCILAEMREFPGL